MNQRRRIVLASVAIAIVAGVFALSQLTDKPKPAERAKDADPNFVELPVDAQRNAGVVIVAARQQAITREVRITGIVSPDESRVAHIFPLAQGVVEQVKVRLGDRVTQGQALLVYDNIELGELIGQYQSLRAGLQKQLAQKDVSEKVFARAKSLLEVQAISQREYDLRSAEYQQAIAEVESQRAEVARTEEKLHRFGLTDEDLMALKPAEGESHRTASHNTLRAPFAGVIIRYEVSQGEVVDRQKELFTIVDTSTVWVLGDVYEKDIQEVRKRGECLVELAAFPGEIFRGRITYLSDMLDPASRTAKLRCVVPNSDGRLKLEMFGSVRVPVQGTLQALTLPAASVQDVNGEAVVFVQRSETQFEKRPVKLGDRNNQVVRVIEGVRPGEKVVSNGSFYLKSALLREQMGEEE